MEAELITDLAKLSNGDRVKLFPNNENPLHKHPVLATFQGGYFYCDGSPPEDGPDYYFRDVFQFNHGFLFAE